MQWENKHHTCGRRPAGPIVELEVLFLSLLVGRKEAAPAQMNAAAAFKSPVRTLHLIIARPSQPSEQIHNLVSLFFFSWIKEWRHFLVE